MMNPLSQMSGLSVAAIVILALIVVVLALVVIKQLKPNSLVARDVTRMEGAVSDFVPTAERWGHVFATDAEALAAGFKRIEPILQTELQAVLTAAEKRLTNTAAEDARIAAAVADTAAANSDKATKLALIQSHIANLQAHIAAQSAV